jgi:hypothetical protein
MNCILYKYKLIPPRDNKKKVMQSFRSRKSNKKSGSMSRVKGKKKIELYSSV